MFLRIFFILLFTLFLNGCGRGNDKQFFGKWTFDRDYTLAHIPKGLLNSPSTAPSAKPSPTESPWNMSAMFKGLNTMLADQLINQMDGQTFTITSKTTTDSSGQTRTYKVLERPTLNDLSMKLSNGDIWTLTTEDGRIAIPTTGSVHFNMYFKRISG